MVGGLVEIGHWRTMERHLLVVRGRHEPEREEVATQELGHPPRRAHPSRDVLCATLKIFWASTMRSKSCSAYRREKNESPQCERKQRSPFLTSWAALDSRLHTGDIGHSTTPFIHWLFFCVASRRSRTLDRSTRLNARFQSMGCPWSTAS